MCLQQALNARGVTDLVLNSDAHADYGAPVGCMLTSPTHVYPGPVGVDIKCSMSFLQLNLAADQVADKTVRRQRSRPAPGPLRYLRFRHQSARCGINDQPFASRRSQSRFNLETISRRDPQFAQRRG